MVDFREIAQKAKAQNGVTIAEQEKKHQQERDARSSYVDSIVGSLEKHVIPLLQQAREEFMAEGIEAVIATEYDVKNRHESVKPSIQFSCRGPRRKSDGWQFETAAITFSSDGERVYVERKDTYDSRSKDYVGTESIVDAEKVVVKAMERALTAYYEDLEKHKHSL